ncbi:23S rRNA (guanosine(2251)-2'-O)-methyltransferase RlmB, partial [Lactobacillus sp. XV13L]|nr:23S rRNA (guanosine(2251)-2'-O)-methyltransferase RlmB [Lactobacillus sp. XV13L]
PYEYVELDHILNDLQKKQQDPFFLILDNINDPHNFGSILRTADAVGVNGIIIPKRRAVGVTSVVAKASTGAIEHLPIARVTNLVQTIEWLKQKNIWIFGTDMNGTDYRQWNAQGAIALVIGNEGKGMSPLVKRQVDQILTIPMVGHVQSLNASVATGVLLYQAFTSRES